MPDTPPIMEMTYAQATDLLIKRELIPDALSLVVTFVTTAVCILSMRAGLKTYKELLQAIAAILDHLTFNKIHRSMQPILDHLESVMMDINQEELTLHSQLDDIKENHKISCELLVKQEALLRKYGDMVVQIQTHLTMLKALPVPAASYSVALLSAANLSSNSSLVSDPGFVQQLITRQCQVLINTEEGFASSISIDELSSWT